MPEQTPNFNFDKPIEGGDDDVWGGFLNANWEKLDALLSEIRNEARYQVGDLYFSDEGTDPATKLGYGTWEVYAAGRVPVGVGNNGESDWVAGEERGAETHQLSASELPRHRHTIPSLSGSTNNAGIHGHSQRMAPPTGSLGSTYRVGNSRITGSYINSGDTTSLAGSHAHSVSTNASNTGYVGSDTPHNNVQPAIGVYIWKRTA